LKNKRNNIINRIKNIKKIYILFIILVSITFIIILSTYIFSIKLKLPPQSYIIYDSNNIQIWEIINNKKYRHQYIGLDKFPIFLQKAVYTIEDKNFYNHNGIDFWALIRASINNIQWNPRQWGSTISSQLIKNMYRLNKPRTFRRKLQEFYLAIALNNNYSKNKILESYLNIISFGYLNYGFESASNYYFNKSIQNLTKAETIALLSLPKNPNKYNPYIYQKAFQDRFNMLAKYLLKNNLLNQKEYNEVLQEKLLFNKNHDPKLPYIKDIIEQYTIKNKSPFQLSQQHILSWIQNNQIHTHIDYYLTQKIDQLAKNSIKELKRKNVNDYWIIILNRHKNTLKVNIGWIDYRWEQWQVNTTLSLNQAGSTIKAFTYLLAFQNLGLQADDIILDLPIQYQTLQWFAYTPQNYSLDYQQETSIAKALSQSLNIPAITLAEQLWTEKLLNFLHQLGFISLNENADHYGLALTLWVWEISLFELTRAFSLIANNWNLCEILILKNQKPSCKKIIDSKYTQEIENILSNRYFKLKGFPIGSNLDFPDRFVTLKSWTSRNFSDNRVVWYTQNYVIWVRVGNKDGSNMKKVSWASGAWDIFKKIVYELEQKHHTQDFIPQTKTKTQDYLRISSPFNNSKYQIDSSIPTEQQAIKLEFFTNLDYDKFQRYQNNIPITTQALPIQKWSFTISLKLFKDSKLIKTQSSKITILKDN